MQREELKSAFIKAIRKNDLYNDDAIVIPKEIARMFMDDFFNELLSREECQIKKKYYFNYIRKVMLDKGWYINEYRILDFVEEYLHDDIDFEDVKIELRICSNWSTFWARIEKKFGIEDIN